MKLSNIFVWAALVILTLLSFYSSESTFSGIKLAFLIMGIVFIKFIGIGFQFMELKKAHIAWKLLFTGFIVLFSLMVLVIS